MALSDIAAGLEVTTEQRDRGVAAVDDTDGDLAARLAPHAAELPCDAPAAAALVDAYTTGRSIGECARAAELAPVAAAKTLHLLGVEGVSPLGPTGRAVVRDWIEGALPRSEAERLADVSGTTFALAAFVETHDPLPEAAAAVEGALAPGGDAAVAKREALDEAMGDPADLL